MSGLTIILIKRKRLVSYNFIQLDALLAILLHKNVLFYVQMIVTQQNRKNKNRGVSCPKTDFDTSDLG